MKVEAYKHNNIDPESIDSVLFKIQQLFNIKLDNEELKSVDSLDSLCEVIVNEINKVYSNCTTQHAFYILREAIATISNIDRSDINPRTKLAEIFPPGYCLQGIASLERQLGFKIKLFQPKLSIVTLFTCTLIGSFIICFYNLPIGIAGLLSSGISLKFSGKFGKEMHLKTLGELANKIARQNYFSAGNEVTINKYEIKQKIKELFINDPTPRPIVLTGKSQFN